MIETAFGDEEHGLARISRHLCPSSLGGELAQLRGPQNESVDVHITHIKPGEDRRVMAEIAALATPHRIHLLATGGRWLLGDRPAGLPPQGDQSRHSATLLVVPGGRRMTISVTCGRCGLP